MPEASANARRGHGTGRSLDSQWCGKEEEHGSVLAQLREETASALTQASTRSVTIPVALQPIPCREPNSVPHLQMPDESLGEQAIPQPGSRLAQPTSTLPPSRVLPSHNPTSISHQSDNMSTIPSNLPFPAMQHLAGGTGALPLRAATFYQAPPAPDAFPAFNLAHSPSTYVQAPSMPVGPLSLFPTLNPQGPAPNPPLPPNISRPGALQLALLQLLQGHPPYQRR
jgi:hypothetical protein